MVNFKRRLCDLPPGGSSIDGLKADIGASRLKEELHKTSQLVNFILIRNDGRPNVIKFITTKITRNGWDILTSLRVIAFMGEMRNSLKILVEITEGKRKITNIWEEILK